MIRPEQFYKDDELPDRNARKRMWGTIAAQGSTKKPFLFFINDRVSFLYGMAATILLYLAGVGGVTILKQSIENTRPAAIQVDKAYQSAIREFERIVPFVVSLPKEKPQQEGEFVARRDQLQLLDSAIVSLRSETASNDLSPLKRARLRELYSLKLQILQQMIEQGEIEL